MYIWILGVTFGFWWPVRGFFFFLFFWVRCWFEFGVEALEMQVFNFCFSNGLVSVVFFFLEILDF